jgi:4-aminobutyrate aminotransferase
MPDDPKPPDHLKSEGDLNLSPRRQAWLREHIDGGTRHRLEEDAKYFLHQSLSTPCLNVLTGCKGAHIEDLQGRKLLDFHGNNVHQVGFGHPRVIEAITKQMKELSFCTRRYSNVPAIQLAKKLTALSNRCLRRRATSLPSSPKPSAAPRTSLRLIIGDACALRATNTVRY